jgi:serine/threonine protein kinase
MFLAMEYFDGEPLHMLVHGPRSAPIPPELLPQFAHGILSGAARMFNRLSIPEHRTDGATQDIHKNGFIYTDIKFTNILIRKVLGSPRASPKPLDKYHVILIDFGLARASADQWHVSDGTERAGISVAPEILLGNSPDLGLFISI